MGSRICIAPFGELRQVYACVIGLRFSEKVFVSQERVSGFPEKGLTSGEVAEKLPGKSGELPGKSGKLPGTSGSEGKNNINIYFSDRIPGGRTPGKALFSRTQKVYARPFSTVKHREFLA